MPAKEKTKPSTSLKIFKWFSWITAILIVFLSIANAIYFWRAGQGKLPGSTTSTILVILNIIGGLLMLILFIVALVMTFKKHKEVVEEEKPSSTTPKPSPQPSSAPKETTPVEKKLEKKKKEQKKIPLYAEPGDIPSSTEEAAELKRLISGAQQSFI